MGKVHHGRVQLLARCCEPILLEIEPPRRFLSIGSIFNKSAHNRADSEPILLGGAMLAM